MRRLALLVVPLALAACGSSKESAPTTTVVPTQPPATTPPATTSPAVPAQHPVKGKIKVAVKAPTHRPKANAPWHYSVAVTAKGKPQPARIYLQIMYRGNSVGNIGTHIVPNGKWAETIRWPAASRGHNLVFSVRAVSNGRFAEAKYPIRVQ